MKNSKQTVRYLNEGDVFELCVPVKVTRKQVTSNSLHELNGGAKSFSLTLAGDAGPFQGRVCYAATSENDKVNVLSTAKRPSLWARIKGWFNVRKG